MKKIITLISVFCLASLHAANAQDIETIKAELYKAAENNTYLKDFTFELEPKKIARYSVVLSKNSKYQFMYYQIEPNQIEFNLYQGTGNNSNKNQSSGTKESSEKVTPLQIEEPSNPEIPVKVEVDKNIIKAEYVVSKTGVFHMVIKNNSNKKVKTVLLLNFVEKIDQPEPKEEIVVITSSGNKNAGTSENSDETFFVVEDMPKFNGESSDNFKQFIMNELKYPQEAIDKKIEGRVFVQFTIDKEGYIKDAKVVRKIHPALDQEVLRIVYSSPKWEPGKQRGHVVDVILTFPIIFKLK